MTNKILLGNTEAKDNYSYVKRDLLKSAILSLLAIAVIVVVYWFEVKH